MEGQFSGQGVSFSTIFEILNSIQAMLSKLAAALAEVGNPAKDKEHRVTGNA